MSIIGKGRKKEKEQEGKEQEKNEQKAQILSDVEDDSGNAKAKKKRKHFGKKQKTDQIIRIEELEALMQKYGDDIKPEDMEDIVSMYMPHRKRRKLGAALVNAFFQTHNT